VPHKNRSLPTSRAACRRLTATAIAAMGAVAAAGALFAAGTGPARAQAPVPSAAPPAAPMPTAQVSRWEVQGNTLLPDTELQRLLAPFSGTLTLQQLRAAAAAVQEAYRRAGYGGVVAFLPEQDLSGGLARVRVVEGKLTRVEISDNRQFSADNVRRSLPSLKEGTTPAVRRIDAEIQLANENPAKTISVLLQPGATPGAVEAKIGVQEQPVSRLTARIDNTGGEAIGRWRAALGWQHANLWGLDHVFAGELQTAPEDTAAVKVVSGSYRAPLYGSAMAIDVYGAWSDVDAGKVGTAAGDLSFSGKGGILGTRLSLYLPRLGNTDQRLLLGLEGREYENNCSIAGLPAGACGSAGASVSVQPLSLTWTAQAQGELRWGLSVGLHHNLALGGSHGEPADFEAVRPGSQRRYTLLRAAAQITVPVAETFAIGARLAAQASGRPLVPGEMFGVGGAQSVRGFEERELSGDSGASLTIEATSPNLVQDMAALRGLDLRAVAFADAGVVANQDDAPCQAGRSSCKMGGLGLGLRGQWGLWQLRLDVANARTHATTTVKGDTRAHFSLATLF
jgi:hemolysin activation/secretion protein